MNNEKNNVVELTGNDPFLLRGGSTVFGEDSEKEIKAFLNDFYSLRSDSGLPLSILLLEVIAVGFNVFVMLSILRGISYVRQILYKSDGFRRQLL